MKKATIRYCCNALIMGVAVFACGIFAETSVKAEGTPETVPPIESAAPQVTPEVSAVPTVVTPALSAAPVSLAPVPHVKPLKKVTKVKAVRYSTTAVKVSWKQTKQAEYYHVYYKLEKNRKYKLVGTTQNDHFLVKKLKNKKTYSFYVTAGKRKKESSSDSQPSAKKKMTMKKYQRKVVFAGDSICEGIAYEGGFPTMHLDAKKKVVAYRGLNTVTFHTKRINKGRTGLQKQIAENPYRV